MAIQRPATGGGSAAGVWRSGVMGRVSLIREWGCLPGLVRSLARPNGRVPDRCRHLRLNPAPRRGILLAHDPWMP